jgi:hypothetical protein
MEINLRDISSFVIKHSSLVSCPYPKHYAMKTYAVVSA